MSERYFITGAQLGSLIALRDIAARKKFIEDIEENQFICRLENKSYKKFDKEVKKLGDKLMEEEDGKNEE